MTGPEAQAAGEREYARVTGSLVVPRRPLDDDDPDGYLESDEDWILNNQDAVLAWMTSQCGDESARECGNHPATPVALTEAQRKLLVSGLAALQLQGIRQGSLSATHAEFYDLATLIEGAGSVVVVKGEA